MLIDEYMDVRTTLKKKKNGRTTGDLGRPGINSY